MDKKPLTADEVGVLDDALDLILDRIMAEAEERMQGKADKHGVKMKVSFPEQAKIRGVKLILNMAKNYSPDAKLEKFVTHSNKIVPHLTRVFNEQAIVDVIPAEIKDEKIVALCDKAGATAVASLLRKSMEQKPKT